MRISIVMSSDTLQKVAIRRLKVDPMRLSKTVHTLDEFKEMLVSDSPSVTIIDDSLPFFQDALVILKRRKLGHLIFNQDLERLEKQYHAFLQGSPVDQTEGSEISPLSHDRAIHRPIGAEAADALIPNKENKPVQETEGNNHDTAPSSGKTTYVEVPVPLEIERIVKVEVPVPVEVEKIVEIEVPVERVLIREVPVQVEKIVEKHIAEVIELKPNFDHVQIDFELPSILPDISTTVAEIAATGESQGPVLIGVTSLESEVDAASPVLAIASSLVRLGYRPLVVADHAEVIDMIEEQAYRGEKEDPDAELFEAEGITFKRRGIHWQYSDLLATRFTHIVLWFDSLDQRDARARESDWIRTTYPLLLANGLRWKLDKHRAILTELGEAVQKRCRLLITSAQPHVVKDLNSHFPNMDIRSLPLCADPMLPDQQTVRFVSGLLATTKRRKRISWRLFTLGVAVLVMSSLAVWWGLHIDIQKGG